MSGNRVIFHVDMDAFFASVEQHDHPAYRGRPVIVGACPGRRGVVSACSYEAREFGVHSAMPSAEAWRRCPQGIFVPVDMARYADVSRQVSGIFGRFSPYVEPLSIDEAFIDMTGSAHLFGGVQGAVAHLKKSVQDETGLTCSVGVAPNKFLAKLASELNKPDGITFVPDDIPAFLAPLPVRSIWGVGPVSAKALEQAGIIRIADLQRIGLGPLSSLLGERSAGHLKKLALGLDARPLETDTEEKSMSREVTFHEDEPDRAVVYSELLRLVDAVAARLRQARKYAAGVQIKVRWSDFRTVTRQSTLKKPVSDVFALMDEARALFQRIAVEQPVRLIGFGVHNLTSHPVRQLDLFEDCSADEKRQRVSGALDRIREKYGAGSIRLGTAGKQECQLPPVASNSHYGAHAEA